jgi:hypothetical protein
MGGSCPDSCRSRIPALDFIREDLFQELDVAEVVLTRQGDPLGQGVEQLPEAQPSHERL